MQIRLQNYLRQGISLENKYKLHDKNARNTLNKLKGRVKVKLNILVFPFFLNKGKFLKKYFSFIEVAGIFYYNNT